MRVRIPKALRAKLRRVRLFLCDVDGVLTDGTVLMGNAREMKRFNIRDGLGLRLLQREGIKVGWVSRRPSAATEQRARDLKIDYLHQGDNDKVLAIEGILKQARVTWDEVCFVGDDIVDLSVLKRAGVAVVVGNGIDEAKAVADYVTQARGGHGAVREIVEMILKSQMMWSRLVGEYSS